ncbi:hypothetical protein C3495_06260 [Clostridiaceae bacterium 14S0207]|nr:hypothetical protein C3495_06260 [Clostridiaceae bacterium 14S0207]
MKKEFKDVFSYNYDTDKTAYMNWRLDKNTKISNMISIANGYIQSSIMLLESVIKDNRGKRADVIIFPIVFNANHGIEVYLKSILWSLNILLDNDHKAEGKHDIKQIFQDVKAKMEHFEKNKHIKREFKNMTENLEQYIEELDEKLNKTSKNGKYRDNMDFSRYPFNVKYENHFYVDELDNVVVDLENFLERLKEIGKNLDSISRRYLYEFLDPIGKEV